MRITDALVLRDAERSYGEQPHDINLLLPTIILFKQDLLSVKYAGKLLINKKYLDTKPHSQGAPQLHHQATNLD